MMSNAEILICVKWDEFNLASEFSFLTGLCVFSNMKNTTRVMYYPASREQISDALAADVNAKSIFNFNFKSFRLRSLSYGKVVKKSITRFTSQI